MRDFKHTMDVLVRAYFNDTLKHRSCTACAVGNLVGESIGAVTAVPPALRSTLWHFPDHSRREAHWMVVFCTQFPDDAQEVNPENYQGEAKYEIDATGYTWEELARIEFAFESASRGISDDDWMLNGLLAVLEVLAQIHEVDFSGALVYERQLSEIHATK